MVNQIGIKMINYKLIETENHEKMVEIANFPGLDAVLSLNDIKSMILKLSEAKKALESDQSMDM